MIIPILSMLFCCAFGLVSVYAFSLVSAQVLLYGFLMFTAAALTVHVAALAWVTQGEIARSRSMPSRFAGGHA
jgi:hypothetical protein